MTAKTKEELVEVWRRAFDSSYTDPLEDEDDGRGVDQVYAFAAIMERVGASVDVSTQAIYITPPSEQSNSPAAGQVRATGSILVSRTFPAHGTLELLTGDVLEVTQLDTKGSTIVVTEIELTEDWSLDPSDVDVPLDVQAIRSGYQANGGPLRSVRFKERSIAVVDDATTSGNTITDDGTPDRFVEGMEEGGFVRFVFGANAGVEPRRILTASLGSVTVDGDALISGSDNVEVVGLNDLGVIVELDGDLTGGVHGWLDLHGTERLIGRSFSEVDGAYRERVLALPDIVSPNAVIRAASRILRPKGISFEFVETRDPDLDVFRGFFYDLDPYDDPDATMEGNRRLMTGANFQTMGFLIVIERIVLSEFGFPYDTNPATSNLDDNAYDLGFLDGYDFVFFDTLGNLIVEIEKTKAIGVPWAIVIVDTL